MSREVIGDAPVGGSAERDAERTVEHERLRAQTRLAAVLRASRQALLPVADVLPPRDAAADRPVARPEPSRERSRRRLPALAAATAMGLVVTGWAAYSVTEPPGDPARGVVAVVSSATAAATDSATRRALLTITISNPGAEAVSATGYAYTSRSSGAVGLDEPTAHVAPGTRVEVTVDVALDCAKAAPLLLPNLVIEEQDGGRRQIAAIGAVAALMGICADGPDSGHPLTVLSTRRDGDDLMVDVAAPSNRRTEIRGVRATGVPLQVAPVPALVDRRGRELRVTPPATCPTAWRDDGIPQVLEVDVDTVGPSTSFLHVGRPLASWALDVVCRGVT